MNGPPGARAPSLLLAFVLALAPAAAAAQRAQAEVKAARPEAARQLSVENRPWKGDFDEMLERRMIRVLAPYSRTLYYVDRGHERGVSAELVRDVERYLNQKYARQLGKRPLTVYLIPTTRDRLLPELIRGRGDIAAGNLTMTGERLKLVDFVAPTDHRPTQELIVTGPRSPDVASLDDLSGKTVHLRPSSSYHESVVALNAELRKARRAPVRIVPLPDALEDEDVLEMLNAGLLQLAVVDDWKARMWAQVLPKIKVREDLVLRAQGYVGWAYRKGSPKLTAALLDAYYAVTKQRGSMEVRQAGYHKRVKQIADSTDSAELRRFEQAVALFEKYGAQYHFDPLMLAAQGYQESRLRQEARSRGGAVGVMQIMPATAKELGVGDIRQLEPNIHAGAKYMDQLMTRYFPDAKFSDAVRPLFAFASYNAGPGAIARMRKEAGQRGLDPDLWFNHVEIVVAERIGMETTTYVRNIYKYYVAYRLIAEARRAGREARESVEQKR